ncbi:DUF3052 domain-containing protein [Roseateles violae]|uniref:DUF3052 domain-containing protein n=1 Tax=Roseateles violae TaxID=3058042 RepID=A0ABT8DSS0_9BURK|nr:DUF3052 domain-containing protein [Pelomonas sp. PFR6]MDN3921371.1 DUF3052 domain-containing protein [Pelomonas sp. PFR6]
MSIPAGYSGTSLAKKLGIKSGQRLLLIAAPPGYEALLAPLPADVAFVAEPDRSVELVQLFVTQKGVLAEQLSALRRTLAPAAALWVSWPKKASKLPTTITEDVIRELALPLGFVDIKVCAVDAVWSGLKLVLRKELR